MDKEHYTREQVIAIGQDIGRVLGSQGFPLAWQTVYLEYVDAFQSLENSHTNSMKEVHLALQVMGKVGSHLKMAVEKAQLELAQTQQKPGPDEYQGFNTNQQ